MAFFCAEEPSAETGLVPQSTFSPASAGLPPPWGTFLVGAAGGQHERAGREESERSTVPLDLHFVPPDQGNTVGAARCRSSPNAKQWEWIRAMQRVNAK
ncbi:hypothetical protein [Saccharopolyspora gregorii]|uniref:Uncharacterized protein n=1 Tax=Saccharopolyspora gregorii TaxID=33914 RepID=A0ABP6S384_9PSEU